jgi:hypothetical protein
MMEREEPQRRGGRGGTQSCWGGGGVVPVWSAPAERVFERRRRFGLAVTR